MSEAIKGQDKLKLAVEKLEVELFKDWPESGVIAHGGLGMLITGVVQPCTFTNCTFTNAPSGAQEMK